MRTYIFIFLVFTISFVFLDCVAIYLLLSL